MEHGTWTKWRRGKALASPEKRSGCGKVVRSPNSGLTLRVRVSLRTDLQVCPYGRADAAALAALAFGAELAAAEDVHVQVRHRHPGVVADVEGDAEAAVGDAFVRRHFGRRHEHAGEERAVLAPHVLGGADVLSGQHEKVPRRARAVVEDDDDEVVVI